MDDRTSVTSRRALLTETTLAFVAVTAGCLEGPAASNPGDERGKNEPLETPVVDEPPHDPERPNPSGEEPWEEWNDDYLGEGMATEPTVEFDRVSGVRLAESMLAGRATELEGGVYSVRLLASERDLETVVDLEKTDSDARTALESVDFDERIVIVVESGYGSSSVAHRWVRVEPLENGIHLHGYETNPYEQTADASPRHSVLIVDRPDGGALEVARVSQTVAEDRRVHYASTDGVATPQERS
ncbi:hypothetical protein [Natronobacterium texcoconense]|uniref:Uncharacterized protein n=1 Tax=Natronobacterium texcoconense TaxID=1095778 RepID=A0A1H1IXB2_NATTX|nr:hypothetical protein [Natronobacterium texcoconense]SDR42016.1 hypothetical protein SAMN04489842_3852 [Natronobacterium texcoconense]